MIKRSIPPGENVFNEQLLLIKAWKYNIRRNVNSDVSIVIIRRVAITVFELEVVKNFMQNFNRKRLHDYFFVKKIVLNCKRNRN